MSHLRIRNLPYPPKIRCKAIKICLPQQNTWQDGQAEAPMGTVDNIEYGDEIVWGVEGEAELE
jgi:hypothetical protein